MSFVTPAPTEREVQEIEELVRLATAGPSDELLQQIKLVRDEFSALEEERRKI